MILIVILERAVPATALIVRKPETLSEAFSLVDPQRCLLHPAHHQGHNLQCLFRPKPDILSEGFFWPEPDILSEGFFLTRTWYPVWGTCEPVRGHFWHLRPPRASFEALQHCRWSPPPVKRKLPNFPSHENQFSISAWTFTWSSGNTFIHILRPH